MVWSAAVASSSLPGVFEANRLVVKEADGWERYESGGSQHFSDGSMEQDLPMQQLSEMFNVNHFIISQANPHAVMFASYNQKIGVWTNPIVGVASSILTFLKDQLRSWLLHLVDCIGARRIAPIFETQRGIGTQFFTQEYEGRSSDISLIPWIGHRGLLSAMLHIIYNPSEAEFREWVQAAERETWKHIPAIKSHIAEEITLDRCVQRLRKRLVQESWEKQALASEGEVDLGGRVPSFFKSPSLVNLGGLGVSDQPKIGGLDNLKTPESPVPQKPEAIIPDIDINSGWGGMGLRGNRSSGNLHRTSSDASGLFIDEEEYSTEQDAGERTDMAPKKLNSTASLPSKKSLEELSYVKTTSMAKFYYRKVNTGSTQQLSDMAKTNSVPNIDNEDPESTSGGVAKRSMHQRTKSKSLADLKGTAGQL